MSDLGLHLSYVNCLNPQVVKFPNCVRLLFYYYCCFTFHTHRGWKPPPPTPHPPTPSLCMLSSSSSSSPLRCCYGNIWDSGCCCCCWPDLVANPVVVNSRAPSLHSQLALSESNLWWTDMSLKKSWSVQKECCMDPRRHMLSDRDH